MPRLLSPRLVRVYVFLQVLSLKDETRVVTDGRDLEVGTDRKQTLKVPVGVAGARGSRDPSARVNSLRGTRDGGESDNLARQGSETRIEKGRNRTSTTVSTVR